MCVFKVCSCKFAEILGDLVSPKRYEQCFKFTVPSLCLNFDLAEI